MDAAPYLLEHLSEARPGEVVAFTHVEKADPTRPCALLRELRRALSWCRGDAVFLAEATVGPDQVDDFWGRLRVLDAGDPAVFAHRSETADGAVVAVHNRADRPARATVPVGDGERLADLLGERAGAGGWPAVDLPPYGYR